MQRLSPWLFLLSLLCLGGAVYGYLERGAELSRQEKRITELTARDSDRLVKVEKQLAAAEKARVASDQLYQKLKAGAAASAPATPSVTRVEGYGMGLMDQMRKDPAYAALWHKQQLRNIERQYGDALAALKLPPDQLAKVRELLVARNEARMDANEEGRQQGLTGPDLAQAVQDAQGAVTDEIKAQIGDDTYQKMEQTSRVSMFKGMIDSSVGIDLQAAGAPLNPTQETVLEQGMSTMFTGGRGTRNQTPDPTTGLTPAFQTILDQMTPNLAPEQVPVVKDYLVEQLQQQAYFKAHPPKINR